MLQDDVDRFRQETKDLTRLWDGIENQAGDPPEAELPREQMDAFAEYHLIAALGSEYPSIARAARFK